MPAPEPSWLSLDKQLLDEVLAFVSEHDPETFQAAVEEFPLDMAEPSGEDVALFYTWMAHAWRFAGRTGAEWFWRERGAGLAEPARGWMQSSLASWTSYWEVLEVSPGASLRIRDLFTDEERRIADAEVSRSVAPGAVLLARVIDHRAGALFGALHGHLLPIGVARGLVEEIRQELKLPRPATPGRLREGETPVELIFYFHDEVQTLRDQAPPPLAS
jgi:hypothetical protein